MWLMSKKQNIYVKAEKVEDKTMHSFVAGYNNFAELNSYSFIAVPGLPEGSHLTSICECGDPFMVGIDEKQQVYIWDYIGQDIDFKDLFEAEHPTSEPTPVKWFTENELKVTKADCGKDFVVV